MFSTKSSVLEFVISFNYITINFHQIPKFQGKITPDGFNLVKSMTYDLYK